MPHSGVQIKVDRGGGVAVFCGSTDIGQGSDSVLAYVVAEELGIRPEDIRVVTADTDLTPVDLGSYSSRVTLMTGNAAIQAARRVREPIFEAAARKLEVPASSACAPADRRIWDAADPSRSLALRGGGRAGRGRVRHAGRGRLLQAAAARSRKWKGAGVGPTPPTRTRRRWSSSRADRETGHHPRRQGLDRARRGQVASTRCS